MVFSQLFAALAGNDERQQDQVPPAYEPHENLPLYEKLIAQQAGSKQLPSPETPLPTLDLDIAFGLVNSAARFRFSSQRLRGKGCGRLVDLLSDADSITKSVEGESDDPFFAHRDVEPALRLLETWVETGILKSIVKHESYTKLTYFALYVLTDSFGSEVLSNKAIDEIIARYDATGFRLCQVRVRSVVEMCVDEADVPYQLKRLLVSYIASQPSIVEAELAKGESASGCQSGMLI